MIGLEQMQFYHSASPRNSCIVHKKYIEMVPETSEFRTQYFNYKEPHDENSLVRAHSMAVMIRKLKYQFEHHYFA